MKKNTIYTMCLISLCSASSLTAMQGRSYLMRMLDESGSNFEKQLGILNASSPADRTELIQFMQEVDPETQKQRALVNTSKTKPTLASLAKSAVIAGNGALLVAVGVNLSNLSDCKYHQSSINPAVFTVAGTGMFGWGSYKLLTKLHTRYLASQRIDRLKRLTESRNKVQSLLNASGIQASIMLYPMPQGSMVLTPQPTCSASTNSTNLIDN